MEKIRSIRTVLAFSLVFLLAGCSGKQDGAMTIQKAELTVKEQQTVALIETGRSVKLYDYKTEPGISSLLFSVETLNEQGQWETVASSVFSQSGQEEDRVAILFSDDSITFSCGDGRYEVMLGSNHYKSTADSWLTESSPIRTDEKIVLLVRKGEASAISYRIKPAENLRAPVEEGQQAGTLEITKNDEPFGEYALSASTDVRKADLKTLIIRSTEQILKG